MEDETLVLPALGGMLAQRQCRQINATVPPRPRSAPCAYSGHGVAEFGKPSVKQQTYCANVAFGALSMS